MYNSSHFCSYLIRQLKIRNVTSGSKVFLKIKIYSLSKRASFLSIQMVAKGKNAASNAKTVSSSSHSKIFRAGINSSKYNVKNKP